MDSLPTETILHIISFLSTYDLKHLSLISTKFTPLAQPVVCESIHLMDGGKICSRNFADFVSAVIKSSQIAVMIKRLEIGLGFCKFRHHQPLVQLLEQVHNLRELLCHPYITPPSIPFRPHQFPRLHRIQWPLQGTGTDILHELLPYSPVTDLFLFGCPTHFQCKFAFAALLEPSPSKWIDNLVKYRGYSYLIEGLSEAAKLSHLCSTNPLSEETLRGLASQRLLSLHIDTPPYPQSLEEPCLPPSLLPPLFPNLQSVVCLSVQLGPGVHDFFQNSQLPANGRLQMLRPFQDPANGPLIACLQQLHDLRRVAFVLVDATQKWAFYDRFITDLQEFVQEHTLPLEMIYIRRDNREAYWLGRYTKQINSRGDLVSWGVERYIRERLEFVDQW